MAYMGKTLELLQAPNNVNRRRLHGSVAHEIAVIIIGGSLPPGEVLPNEDTLSAALNVSRTAYREGIRTLVAKGLLSARPKVGTTVNPRASWNILDGDVLSWYFEVAPDPAFITSLFELRSIVEPAAARFACERHGPDEATMMKAALEGMKQSHTAPHLILEADLAFHRAILVSSKNEAILALSSVIESTLRWSARLKVLTSPRIYESSLPQHESVLEAILARDSAGAAEQLRVLVERALRQTLEALEQRPAD